MQFPALIEGMPFETYNADKITPKPSLRSGAIKQFAETAPLKVWLKDSRLNPEAEPTHKQDFDLGSAAHEMFVGGGDPIVVLDAKFKNYYTKAAKTARNLAYLEGKTPLLAHQYEAVEQMASQAVLQFGLTDIADVVSDPGAKKEATIYWIEAGVYCRCRPDILSLETDPPTIVHYKTTKIDINATSIMRHAAQQQWHVAAAHYRSGVKALTGKAPRQVFAVQESKPPYLCKPCELDNQFLRYGRADCEKALFLWAEGVNRGEWSNLGPETARVSPPAWLRYQYEF